jgi:hypothetical protein
MNARVQKLRMKGLSRADAEILVRAGLDRPSKIRDADTLPDGVSERVRQRFPKRVAP